MCQSEWVIAVLLLVVQFAACVYYYYLHKMQRKAEQDFRLWWKQQLDNLKER